MNKQFGEIIQFIDGQAYGITPELKTIFLGKEEGIKGYLANPTKIYDNLQINEIIEAERNLLKEDKDGKSTTAATVTALRPQKSRQRVHQRIRPCSFPRSNARNSKPTAPTTKPAIHKT